MALLKRRILRRAAMAVAGAAWSSAMLPITAWAAAGDWAKEGEAFVQKLTEELQPIVTSVVGVSILGLAGFLLLTGRIDGGWIFRILLSGAFISFGYSAWELLFV